MLCSIFRSLWLPGFCAASSEFHKYITRCYFGQLQDKACLRSSGCPLPLCSLAVEVPRKQNEGTKLLVHLSPGRPLILAQPGSEGVTSRFCGVCFELTCSFSALSPPESGACGESAPKLEHVHQMMDLKHCAWAKGQGQAGINLLEVFFFVWGLRDEPG